MIRLRSRVSARRTERLESDWRDFLPETKVISLSPAELCDVHRRELVQTNSPSLADWLSFHRRFVDEFGTLPLREHDVRVWRAWLHARRTDRRPLAPRTLSKALAMASVLYGVAIRHGAMEANPIRDIPHTERPGRRLIDPLKAQRGVLRLSEISTILRAARRAHGADFFDALLFAGGLFLGARIGELAGARWMDYDRAVRPLGALTLGRQFHVKSGTFRGTKDGMAKVIPVHPVLAGLLERVPVLFRQLADRGLVETDPLFPFFPRLRNGEPSGELRHWNQRTALVRWKEFQRAELPPAPDGWRNVHGLRHSFVTRLRAAGADPHAVRSLTHPATLRTSGDAHLAYVHVDWDGLCAAVKALDFSKEVTGPVQIALDLNKAG